MQASQPSQHSAVAVAEPPRDKAAYQALAHAQLPRLLALARRLTRRDEDAEELVQEALLRGYQSYRTLKADDAGGRWLRTILVNIHCDRARKRARSIEELPVEDPDDFSLHRKLVQERAFPYSDPVHLDFAHSFTREDVRNILLRLPEIYRAPLVLFHMEGFSTKEIANLCRTPLGTVLARLHRGRKAFERELWAYAEGRDLLKEPSAV